MPRRSKIMQLPAQVRQELEKLIDEQGYGDYAGLVAWLNDKHKVGVSVSAVSRHGKKLSAKLAAVKVASEQARAIAEAAPDDSGRLNQALISLTQEKIFSHLLELQKSGDEIDLEKYTKSITQLIRATLAQHQFTALNEQSRPGKKSATKKARAKKMKELRAIMFGA